MRMILFATAVGASAAGAARADELLNIQFGADTATATGPGVLGTDGDAWNLFTNGDPTGSYNIGSNGGTPVGLVDSSGHATGVTLSYTGNQIATFSERDLNPTAGFAFDGTPDQALFNSYLYDVSSDRSLDIHVAGLAANTAYEIAAIAESDSDAADGRRSAYWSANGGAEGFMQPEYTSAYVQGVDYTTFTGITNAAGVLDITDRTGGTWDREVDLNGLQLLGPAGTGLQAAATQVPEPAATVPVIAVLGVVLMVVYRRRSDWTHAAGLAA